MSKKKRKSEVEMDIESIDKEIAKLDLRLNAINSIIDNLEPPIKKRRKMINENKDGINGHNKHINNSENMHVDNLDENGKDNLSTKKKMM